MEIKKFMLFAGERYYPLGGMRDYIGSFDTLEECFEAFKKPTKYGISWNEWANVLNTESGEIAQFKPKTRGCKGPCACTGKCREVLGWEKMR